MKLASDTLTPPEGFRQLKHGEVLQIGDLRMYISPATGKVRSFTTCDVGRKVSHREGVREGQNHIYIRKNES